MTAKADGWAVINRHNAIEVRTVSPTRRAAILNWLLTDRGLMATHVATDKLIERQWELDSADFCARVARVTIEEVVAS